MADKYTSNEVQALADDFIRFKRYVEDALENLDVNNFADGAWKKMVTKFRDVSSAGFEAYADAEKAIARMFAEYKKDVSNSLASIEAIADANSSKINAIVQYEDDIKNIASIEESADANGAFIKMLVSAGSNGDKDPSDVIASDIAGIYITAMNNNSTEIRLNAKTIAFGNYSSVDSSGNFYATRIFGHGVSDVGEYPGAYFADITSTMAGSSTGEPVGGDFCIRKVPGYSDGIVRDNEDLVYGLMFDKTLGEDAYSVNFVVGSSPNHDGHSVWGYNYGQGKFYPKGEWDFSSCSVSNIPLYFS